MWAQYRKTFWPMQALILAVTLAIYFGLDRLLGRAVTFFVIMQISAVIGALWAARIKALVYRRRTELPLQRRI